MKATELRIGNWVTENGRLIHIHDGFGIDHAYNFEPIPLTEEWLLRFWFEQKTSSFVIYPVSIKRQTKNAFFYSPTSLHLKYVHQLQNLYFALTGEELEIKN